MVPIQLNALQVFKTNGETLFPFRHFRESAHNATKFRPIGWCFGQHPVSF